MDHLTNSCSLASLSATESMAGSAPPTRGWLVVEHPGSWGPNAVEDSALPDSVVTWLRQAELAVDCRVVLARHPDRLRATDERFVWWSLAHPSTPEGWQRTDGSGFVARLKHLDEILDWNPHDFAIDSPQPEAVPLDRPWQFVCTHGNRDVCCARHGRALMKDILGRRDTAWECSHLGGHRFAPTTLVLPSGRMYGRLDQSPPWPNGVEPDPSFLRGSSAVQPVEQVADQFVRSSMKLPTRSSTFTRVKAKGGGESVEDPSRILVEVSDAAGGTWSVVCDATTASSPPSCGRDSQTRPLWVAQGFVSSAGEESSEICP